MRRPALLALVFALGGCLPTHDTPPANDEPVLDPIAFFEGETEGRGTIALVTGQRKTLTVESVGTRIGEGRLRLVQRITEGDAEPRERTWIMIDRGSGRYGGSLTDAEGPVAARASGSGMTIRYETPGERIEQVLTLAPEGPEIANRMDVYKFGLNVARVKETIARR